MYGCYLSCVCFCLSGCVSLCVCVCVCLCLCLCLLCLVMVLRLLVNLHHLSAITWVRFLWKLHIKLHVLVTLYECFICRISPLFLEFCVSLKCRCVFVCLSCFLSVSLSVWLSLCLCLSVCLSVSRCLCFGLCLSACVTYGWVYFCNVNPLWDFVCVSVLSSLSVSTFMCSFVGHQECGEFVVYVCY